MKCPACDKEGFDNLVGLKSHMGNMHGPEFTDTLNFGLELGKEKASPGELELEVLLEKLVGGIQAKGMTNATSSQLEEFKSMVESNYLD